MCEPSTSASLIMTTLPYRRLAGSSSSPIPLPTAVMMLRTSSLPRTRSSRARSTLRILPRSGQDRLVEPVAAPFGGPAGRVALDEEQLARILVVGGAVHQLAGQAAAGEDPLAVPDQVAGLAGRLAGLGRQLGLGDHLLGRLRVLLQELGELLVDDLGDDPLDLAVAQLGLGLPLELRVGHPDADDRGESFLEVLPLDLQVLVPGRGRLLGVDVQRPRQGRPESGEVRPPLDGVDVVAVGHQRLADRFVVLQRDLDFNAPLLVFAGKQHRRMHAGSAPG